jgi:hypothetical protein
MSCKLVAHHQCWLESTLLCPKTVSSPTASSDTGTPRFDPTSPSPASAPFPSPKASSAPKPQKKEKKYQKKKKTKEKVSCQLLPSLLLLSSSSPLDHSLSSVETN